MRRQRSLKRVVPWVIAGFVLVGSPVHALAASGPFTASDAAGLLPGGATLGTVTGLHRTTEDFQGSGPCTDDDSPNGYPHASVFRHTASTRSLLSVDVEDDLGSSLSLCRVAVYDGSGDADPFDAGQRDARLIEQTSECATASACRLDAWLAADRTYLLVLWSAAPSSPGGSSPDDASFELDASVKKPTPLDARVAGHRMRELCSGYHEIVTGRRFTVTALSPLAADVGFVLEALASGGGWSPIASYTRTLSSGRADLTLTAAPAGKRRLTLRIPGDDETLDGVVTVLLHYVTPRWKRYADGGVRLLVPYYRQQHRLSCEAAALRMAHNYHDPGSIDYDMQILRTIGIDRRRRSGNRWGNPNKVFVGSPNGTMMTSGYGVHAGPVARAATRYDSCRPAVKLYRPSRHLLARHINNGHPIVVWGAHRGPSGIKRVRWRAWDGASITAYSVEHTWTVVGFRGSVADPKAFIIHDPSRSAGRRFRTVTLSQYYAFTRYFRSAVVVRG